MKTQDKDLRMSIPLEAIYSGEKIDFELDINEICPVCGGTGAERPEDFSVCPKCNGKGTREVVQRFGPFQTMAEERCSACKGRGHHRKSTCPRCHGKGIETVKSAFEFQVPKGVPEGHVFHFPGRSDQYPGYQPGDVNIQIKSQQGKSKRFQRLNAQDLSLNLDITLLESLVGFEKSVEHLDGHTFVISSDVVQSHGDQLVLKGKGMPIYGSSSQYGDLYVKLSVLFPKTFTPDEKNQIKLLLEQT